MVSRNKGICRLSIVPVRATASHSSEMVTQLLFGDHFEVVETSADTQWLKIKIRFDGYIGWIASNQFSDISDAYFEQLNSADFKVSTDLVSKIMYNKEYINIILGSMLPIASSELFNLEEQLAFNGESKNLSERKGSEYLKATAKKYLGAPYLWGGKTPFGIDCSGFVQQVFKICGYQLSRDASQQEKQGALVKKITDTQLGDLVFFANEKMNIDHVGIILEEGKVIHASGMVRIDTLDEEGIFVKTKNVYSHKLFSIKRILRAEK